MINRENKRKNRQGNDVQRKRKKNKSRKKNR